jgi:2-polyprenyl-3-methyl-5-hydroxy-6-metoxy-1,4-benzoquinol methylase
MDSCPVCGSNEFRELISFGVHPLCSHLYKTKDQKEIFHENKYIFCTQCHFIKINNPVSTSQYEEYEYLSGIQNKFLENFCSLVIKHIKKESDFILDIGSNDGTLLKLIKSKGYGNVLGIEASRFMSKYANESGIETINGFFNEDNAGKILEHKGSPKIIIARFLLEHILDLNEFIKNIKKISSDDTLTMIEVPNTDYTLKNGLYTAFFDQHINYFNMYTLEMLFKNHGLSMHSHLLLESPGKEQSLFCIFSPESGNGNYHGEKNRPKKTDSALIKRFQDEVPKIISELHDLIERLSREKNSIALYGASHIPANIVNFSDIGRYLDYALDKQEIKIGRFMPGSRLEVKNPSFLDNDMPEYCLISAIGNEDKIMQNHQKYLNNGGKFILLFPLRIVAK